MSPLREVFSAGRMLFADLPAVELLADDCRGRVCLALGGLESPDAPCAKRVVPLRMARDEAQLRRLGLLAPLATLASRQLDLFAEVAP
jgi:hypothetical protein